MIKLEKILIKLSIIKAWHILFIICLLLTNIHKNKKWSSPTDSSVNICSDGRGYYAWLPAIFIYHDLNFGFYSTIEKDETFMPNKGCYQNYINTINGFKTNKYYPGTAICMMPFFAFAHSYCLVTNNYLPNGYTTPYFISIGIAGLSALFIGLYFLWQILTLINIPNNIKLFTSLIIIFGTNATYFSIDSPSYSHIYSFCLLNIFLWSILKFKISKSSKYLYISSFILGFIFITRPVNLSIILIIPFIINPLNSYIKIIFSKTNTVIKIILFGLIMPLILLILYKISVNQYFIYSYKTENFDFLSPNIFNFIFSYNNGLVPYLPALAIPILFIYFPFTNTNIKLLSLGLIITITSTIYIHASWWCWWYGSSFGPRTMIDFLGVFAILIAITVHKAPLKFKYLQFVLYTLAIGYTYFLYTNYLYGNLNEFTDKKEYWSIFTKLFN